MKHKKILSLTKIALVFLITLTFVATLPFAGKNRRQGKKFEEAGMYEECAESYYEALKIRDHSKARVGLKKCGAKVLKKKLNAVTEAHRNVQHIEVYQRFIEARDYSNRMRKVKVVLDIPSEHATYFDQSRLVLAEKSYEEGVTSFENSYWQGAIELFTDTLMYSPGHSDAETYLARSIGHRETELAEEFYQKGISSMNEERFRLAYDWFAESMLHRVNYKDAPALMAESLERGRVRIGIFPVTRYADYIDDEERIYAYLISNAVNYPDPFIQVIDRQHLDRLLIEHRLVNSGIVDVTTAARTGRMVGLPVVALINVLGSGYQKDALMTRRMEAKEKYTYEDEEGKQKSATRPVKYRLYENSAESWLEVQYQIISTETGQILISDVLKLAEVDSIKYARYRGDISKLVLPTTTRRQFNARTRLKSPEELASIQGEKMGQILSDRICGYFVEAGR